MKLFYREFGEGKPFVILHGLFGLGDNWNSFAREIASSGFRVVLVDLRNHGRSPHSDDWNYALMSGDLNELFMNLGIHDKGIVLMGHSMGGKVAMHYVLNFNNNVQKLIVVDIGPNGSKPRNEDVVNVIKNLQIDNIKSRKEANLIISKYISDPSMVQFLLKNIYWKTVNEKEDEMLAWRFNAKAITKHIGNVYEGVSGRECVDIDTLFIKGGNSDYLRNSEAAEIHRLFPKSEISEIENAGHWIHVNKPAEFSKRVLTFVK